MLRGINDFSMQNRQYVPTCPDAYSLVTDDNRQDTRRSYRMKVEQILHNYEPDMKRKDAQLLEIYAGIEHELVVCYRAGKGSFCVALYDNNESVLPRALSPGSLQLSVIGTYLQAKLESRRSGATRDTK
ncbi:unnamed protein product [Peronospora belbahrii]|uniref:Uncharacterized protein n=1 Tax=Peronospora belbahrii TaxID=622444 RepID=A0ABN8D5A9_9STRA|nr:unnamed protein product [Peronospora belbahrii]